MPKKDMFFKSKNSKEDYFRWRTERSKEFISCLNKFTSLANKKVLDLGCGQGALSYVLASKGAKVFALDASDAALRQAKEFCKGKNIIFRKSTSKKLPFKDGYFDVITLFYVLEHVSDIKGILDESKRILKKGGYLCVEFPPYYSLTGHHLYRFTLLPMQYFPKSFVKWYLLNGKPDNCQAEDLADVPTTPAAAWNTFRTLSRITISRFRRLSKGMKILDERFIFKYPGFFSVNIGILRDIPVLREVLSLSYFAVMKK